MLEIIKAIILGIVQGITEWLPISSTGHMILVNDIWPMTLSKDFVDLFMVVIQFGSIIAVIVRYFKRLWPLHSDPEKTKSTLVLWGKIIVACIPAAIIGLLFDDLIDTYLYSAIVVAVMLIVYGILFLMVEDKGKDARVKKLDDISFKDAILIGCFQALALIPGTSRSGATILGSITIGLSRVVAAEFSFFLAIPTMLGASFLKIIKFLALSSVGFSGIELVVLLVGMIVAFVVSLFAIGFLMNYIKKHDFKIFGKYRIVLGIIVLAYFLFLK